MISGLAVAAVLAAGPAVAVEYTHAISPTLVYLRGSGWSEAVLKEEFAKVQTIYDQCGIRLDPITVIEMVPLDDRLDLGGQYDFELVTALALDRRPLIFFLRSTGVFYSHGDDFAAQSPMRNLTDTAWLGLDMLSPSYRAARDPRYNPIAHELAHILGNTGHVPAGVRNLLAGEAAFVDNTLTPDQCAQFKRYPLMHPL